MITEINFKKIHPDAIIPKYKTIGAAGADLYSVENIEIESGKTTIIDLGFAVSIPFGYEIQIRSRSGLAIDYGVIVLNSPGTVDADFRGKMKVILSNFGSNTFSVVKGDRIAQMVLAKVEYASFIEVEELTDTVRGEDGFGSTGRT